VETNTTTFALDKSLSQESKDEIIIQSIEKLLEKDSPQLETMKMQVSSSPLLPHQSPSIIYVRSISTVPFLKMIIISIKQFVYIKN
jgi:hypothetical protein